MTFIYGNPSLSVSHEGKHHINAEGDQIPRVLCVFRVFSMARVRPDLMNQLRIVRFSRSGQVQAFSPRSDYPPP